MFVYMVRNSEKCLILTIFSLSQATLYFYFEMVLTISSAQILTIYALLSNQKQISLNYRLKQRKVNLFLHQPLESVFQAKFKLKLVNNNQKNTAKMQIDELTQNGVDILVHGESAIVQIIDRTYIERQGMKFVQSTVSDGFAQLQKCFFNETHFPEKTQPLYSVVEVKLKITQKNRKKLQEGEKKHPVLVAESNPFQIIYSDLKEMIGHPIDYRQFFKNGKKNPKGNNKIRIEDENSDEELTRALQQSKNTALKKGEKKRTSVPKKNVDKKITKPIEKVEQKKQIKEKRKSIKPEVKHRATEYEPVRELFFGIEDFKLMVRVLFVFPIKTITSKKGNQSELLNIEFGDHSGTIMCTCFGELACRYSTLYPDKIYTISGASVTESTYRNQKQLKLNFSDNTKISQVESDQVPTIEHFCKTVKEMSQLQKGQFCNLICLVKDGTVFEGISKQGKPFRRKEVSLYDLDNKIEAQIVMFGDNCNIEFQTGVYALRGVEVDEFQGVKQYKASFTFFARPIKDHYLQKHVSEIEQTEFMNISSAQKTKKSSIQSFTELKEKCENLEEKENVWSEVFCYFRTIRHGSNSKIHYLACPKCKKKVLEVESSVCTSCNEEYEKANYRYILSVHLLDDHDSLWASAFNDAGETLLAKENEQIFLAENFIQLSEDDVAQRLKCLKYKKLKVKLLSGIEIVNGDPKLKHKIVKMSPISYKEENRNILTQIQSILKAM